MWDKYLHFPQAGMILALDCGGQCDAVENTWHLELNLDSKQALSDSRYLHAYPLDTCKRQVWGNTVLENNQLGERGLDL